MSRGAGSNVRKARGGLLGVAVALLGASAVAGPGCSGEEAPADLPGAGAGGGDAGPDSSTGGVGGTSGSGGSGGTSSCVPASCPDIAGFVAGCCKANGTCGYDGSLLGLGCVDLGDILDGGGGDAGSVTCGSNTCTGFGQIAMPCCKPDGSCGYDGSALGLGCVDLSDLQDASAPPPDAGDPTCPSVNTGFVNLTGCCAGGTCSVYVPFLNACVSRAQVPAQFQQFLPPEQPCGGGTGGTGGTGSGGTSGAGGAAGAAGGDAGQD